MQRHLLDTSLITKAQYDGLDAEEKSSLASTNSLQVSGALGGLRVHFKIKFADLTTLTADIVQTNAMSASSAHSLYKLLNSVFSPVGGNVAKDQNLQDGRQQRSTVLYPWRKCCLGVGPDHRLAAATTCQPTLAVTAIRNAWQGKEWQLPVLHGESGSGKSSAMVCCATGESDLTRDMTSGTLVVMVMASEVSDKMNVATDAPKDVIVAACTNAFTKIAAEQMNRLERTLSPGDYSTAKSQLQLVFAIDEASSAQAFVRILCRTRLDVAEQLQGRLGVREVRMVVAGTGATSAVNAPGSVPQYYRLVHVQPANLVEAIRDDLKSRTVSQMPLRIFNAVVTDDLVGAPFVSNPRCAEMVALVARKVAVTGDAWLHPRTVKSMVPSVLAMAAAEFKAKNGCKTFDAAKMYQYMSEALRYCVHPDLAATASVPECLSQAGMVTDHAELVSYTDVAKLGETYDVVVRELNPSQVGANKTALVVAKGERRYRMTVAQVALFSLGYGGCAVASTWQGMEDASALFCAMRLWAMQGATLGELLRLFRPDVAVLNGAEFFEKVTFWRVKIIRLRSKLQGDGDNEPIRRVLARVTHLIAQGYAVVLVNGSCASFADVIAVTKGLVVLAQCKFYGSSTSFTFAAFCDELEKMGYVKPKETCKARATATQKTPMNGYGMTEQLIHIARNSPNDVVNVVIEFITTKTSLCVKDWQSPPHWGVERPALIRQWNTSARDPDSQARWRMSPSSVVPVTFPQHPNGKTDEEIDLSDLAPADATSMGVKVEAQVEDGVTTGTYALVAPPASRLEASPRTNATRASRKRARAAAS